MFTTITGLQNGGSYHVNVYLNGNPYFYTEACGITVDIDGVSRSYPGVLGNNWTLIPIPFVARGTTAAFQVKFLSSGSTCYANLYIGADAVVGEATDVQITKTVSPTGAVASGSVLTYTLAVRNNGPGTTTNALLRDTPSAGLNCNVPSTTATCSASGGASCPDAAVPVSGLIGAGVAIPNVPVGGQVTVTMRCTVTATGR